jgi:beta-lactamase regulating signal transducer with metallopeptidase domain
MLGELWFGIAGRSGEWLAALAALTLKAGVILAVTAAVAFALRRRSAALRHQVWLVGVSSALMLPVLALVLPSVRVAAPWWPGPWRAEDRWGGPWADEAMHVPEIHVPFIEVPDVSVPVIIAPRARIERAQAAVERAAARADGRAEEALAAAQVALAEAVARMNANRERSFADAERQLARAEEVLAAAASRAERRAEARRRSRVLPYAAPGTVGYARAGEPSAYMAVEPIEPVAPIAPLPPLPPIPPVPAIAPLPPVPTPAPRGLPGADEPYAIALDLPGVQAVQVMPPGMSTLPGMVPPLGWNPGGGGFPWGALLLGVWLLGVWFVTAGLVIGALRVAWLSWQAQPVVDGRVTTLARAIADELGVGAVRVLRGSATAMPMTWGLRRATVLIPAGAEDWPVDQLDAVLRHELAHARRRDTLTQLWADIACAIYWFNPLVWLAAYRLRVEREHACDDEVLASGSKPSDYATQLLDMTRALRAARLTAMASIPMARPSQLRDRLEAVLDEDRNRGRVTRPVALRTWACATLLALPLAMLGFVPAPSYADEPEMVAADFGFDVSADWDHEPPNGLPGTGPRHRRPSRASLTDALRARAYAGQEPCWQVRDGDGSLSISRNDERQEIAWWNSSCRGEIRIEGEIEFSDDFTRIVRLARGAEVRLEEDDGRMRRVLEIRPGDGGLAYDYAENGRTHAFDGDAQAWLDGMVLQLMRTGYRAAERVAWLIDAGGVDAVIDELPYLRGDHPRRLYYAAVLLHDDLPAEQAAALIHAAGREIRSDHDLAELLIATGEARPLRDDVRDAFIGAAASIESDHDLRRVLERVLAAEELAPQDVALMLTLARSIESDHDRAELLIGLAERYVTTPELRAGYLEAASDIGSDHDKRRVLESLLSMGALSAEETATVLGLSATIGSDYDRAELLTGLSAEALDDALLQQTYIASAADIGSDHDQRRVLEALVESTELAARELGMLLEAAAGISSDHDKAELLLHIARSQTLNERNRDLFMGALETLGSDHDHRRVTSALLRAGR